VIPLAHLGGLPVEELLLPLAYGSTGLWAAFRVRFLLRSPGRRPRSRARRRAPDAPAEGPPRTTG
jgi:hypothetical protein